MQTEFFHACHAYYHHWPQKCYTTFSGLDLCWGSTGQQKAKKTKAKTNKPTEFIFLHLSTDQDEIWNDDEEVQDIVKIKHAAVICRFAIYFPVYFAWSLFKTEKPAWVMSWDKPLLLACIWMLALMNNFIFKLGVMVLGRYHETLQSDTSLNYLQGHRVTRKLELVQSVCCKVTWNSPKLSQWL